MVVCGVDVAITDVELKGLFVESAIVDLIDVVVEEAVVVKVVVVVEVIDKVVKIQSETKNVLNFL